MLSWCPWKRGLVAELKALKKENKRLMDVLDNVIANEKAEATEIQTLTAKLATLEAAKAGISETDPRWADLAAEQAAIKTALDAALTPPAPAA